MDYLKAYIDALVAKQAEEDERLAALVQERMEELLAQVGQPWREAIRLRAKSEESRKKLLAMLQRDDPAEAILPVALRLISEMTGDEALEIQIERYLRGEPFIPDMEQDTEILRREYQHLVERIEQMATYLGDARVPQEERERAMPQFQAMDERSRALRRVLDTRGES